MKRSQLESKYPINSTIENRNQYKTNIIFAIKESKKLDIKKYEWKLFWKTMTPFLSDKHTLASEYIRNTKLMLSLTIKN